MKPNLASKYTTYLLISLTALVVLPFKVLAQGATTNLACDRSADSLALVALYNSTNGPDWDIPWTLSEPMELWYGVRLTEEGCVISLDLDGAANSGRAANGGNNLVGPLPAEFMNLKHLESLYLSDNVFDSPLPSEIDGLVSLQTLFIMNAGLEGEVPASIGNLVNLLDLVLSNNKLQGEIPETIGNLQNLILLWLHENNLTGNIPSSIGNLRSLETIFLSNNQLAGSIPSSLSFLKQLKVLDLSYNMLSGEVPPNIGVQSELFQIYNLSNNLLSGPIPPQVGSLLNLDILDLSFNDFTGSIPPGLGQLDMFVNILLNDNNLSCFIPAELLKFCGMEDINLSNNPLLPWGGDFIRFCNREMQLGATCNDGDPTTAPDVVAEDCSCGSHVAEIDLIADTSISACGADEIVIIPNEVADTYLWNTGSRERTLTVTTEGMYVLEATIAGNVIRDSVEVRFHQDSLDLGEDKSVCTGIDAVLTSNMDADFYFWNTGAASESIEVTEDGIYWLEVMINKCTFKDTINLEVKGGNLDLGEDRSLCGEQDLFEVSSNLMAQDYLWSTGETSERIVISEEGEYWLSITKDGCSYQDTVVVEKVSGEFEIYTSGNNCIGTTIDLSIAVDYDQILWSNGVDFSNQITIDKSGEQWVEVQVGNCTIRDTTDIVIDVDEALIIPSHTTLCPGDSLVYWENNSTFRLVWNDGHPDGERIINETGIYGYSIIGRNCELSTSIVVEPSNCDPDNCSIYIPNALSADDAIDLNNKFQIYSQCPLSSFTLDVYDRWGNLIYESRDINNVWDFTALDLGLQPTVLALIVNYQIEGDVSVRREMHALTVFR